MIFEEWFDNMLDTYPDDYYGVAKDAWNAAIAARDEELRKQEPVAYTFKQEGSPAYTNNPSFMKLNTQYVYEPLYAAPIPPEPTPSQQEAQWQPIETAPKDGRELILLLTPSKFPQIAYSNTWWTSGFSVECQPTHWMPLPARPDEVTK